MSSNDYNPSVFYNSAQSQACVFILPAIPQVSLIPFLSSEEALRKSDKLFQFISPDSFTGLFREAQSPTQSDFLLIPHTYSQVLPHEEYMKRYVMMAQESSRKLILFAYQDSPAAIELPKDVRAIVFRPATYRLQKAANEIIMPAYVEDLGKEYGLEEHPKGNRPTVGFVGKAGFQNFSHRLRYHVKNALLSHPYKDGIYYRRLAMRSLEQDTRIHTSFLMRSSYSANLKTIPLDPVIARKEYVQNLRESDLALCVKGSGNYSLRFYEALSMGHIPLYIDTDGVLPLEDEIPYDECMLRVSYKDIARLPDILSSWFAGLTEEEFFSRQKLARDIFERHLAMPVFLRRVFKKKFLERYG